MDTVKLEELRGRQAALAGKIKTALDEAGPTTDMSKVKSLQASDSKGKVEEIGTLNSELDALSAEAAPLEAEFANIQRAYEAAKAAEGKGHPLPQIHERKESAEVESVEDFATAVISAAGSIVALKGGPVNLDLAPQATLFKTSAGWAPETTRIGRVVPKETRPIQLIDVMPSLPTSQSAVVYMQEVTFTNSAAEIAEAGEYPESALKLEEKSSPVRKIGTTIPVTDEQLEDEPMARAYLNQRLPFMVRQRLDLQIAAGAGSENELTGLISAAGKEQAKSTDSAIDAVYKARTKVKLEGRGIATHALLHDNDWQGIRLTTTEDGIYLYGPPMDPGPERIWGLPVVLSDALTEGTGLVLDINETALAIRRGVEVRISDSHAETFKEGKQTLRADLRAALVTFKPNAIVKVTGI